MRARGGTAVVALAYALFAGALGCDATPSGGAQPSAAGASPNASIQPAPLASEAPELVTTAPSASGRGGIAADASGRLLADAAPPPPPEALKPDEPLAVEAPGSRELVGVTLQVAFHWRDVPPPPKAPEVSAEGLKNAQKLTSLTWSVDLADAGRMRIVFTSRALPLPERTEIRGRIDRYGAIVLWPNATDYRVLAPGTLRTVLGERRVDVTPLSMVTPVAKGPGRKLGLATRKVELASAIGRVVLELAKVPEAGEGGPVLCRALGEIVGVDPKVPVCQAGDVPLAATYAWAGGASGVTLEVTDLARRTDLSSADLVMPPAGASYAASGLPTAPGGIFLSRDELAAFRTAKLDLPPSDDPSAPGEGFLAMNQTDALEYLLLDGVPVVAVPPASQRYVIGTQRGRYVTQWRTFLGDHVAPPATTELPARIRFGSDPDAGAPDGG
jgi:hypothetical protein